MKEKKSPIHIRLDPKLDRAVREMAKEEYRDLTKTIELLLSEALKARGVKIDG